MSVVLVERSFAEPVRFEALQALEDRAAGCFEAYDVRFLRSYFSRDRRRMICLYEAVDADVVRHVQERAKLPFERVWTASVLRHAGVDAEGEAVLVERTFDRQLGESALRDTAVRSAGCCEARGCRVVTTYLSADGRRATCVFEAPDAESVREAQQRAGLPFDRAWTATIHEP
jgi:Nickel responsive protein SCO4226-like